MTIPVSASAMPNTSRETLGLTLLQTAITIMILCGVSALDALLHAFGTVATGGFSTHTAGLATWGAHVQLVTVVFMVLGALNFAVLGRAFEDLRQLYRTSRDARGKGVAWALALASAVPIFARSIWRNVETRAYVGIVLAASVVMMWILISWGPPRYVGAEGTFQAAADGAFNVATVSTTTGFAQEDFATWPWVAQSILFSLMLMGGCSGSTAGGLKVRRVLILLLFAWGEVRRCAHPRAVFPLRLGSEVVGDAQVREALGFVTTYLALLVLIAVALTATGADGVTAAGASASCFASTGPGLGAAGPAANYQVFSPTGKVLCMAAMILGRLEIYPVLLAITPSFWLRRSAKRRPTTD
jgi:trk system potassium uptake protein